VHKVSQSGFGTGTNDLYDRARPSYQPFTLDFVRESVEASRPLNIIKLGFLDFLNWMWNRHIHPCTLLADPKWNSLIKQLNLAGEPNEGMRGFLQTVKDDCMIGYFDTTGVEDGQADLVRLGLSFKLRQSLGRIRSILKPKGIVALVWNLEDRCVSFSNLIEVHEQGTPQFRHG
ncbi:hypothetical protein BDZ97DRAFT_2036295, partial [Flammula alnicola]